jgi:hypothetical protein
MQRALMSKDAAKAIREEGVQIAWTDSEQFKADPLSYCRVYGIIDNSYPLCAPAKIKFYT